MSKWKNYYNDVRHYKKEWEKKFKWLTWIDNACYCKWCRCSLSNMRKSAFEQHEKTTKHGKNKLVWSPPTQLQVTLKWPSSKGELYFSFGLGQLRHSTDIFLVLRTSLIY